MWTAWTAAPDAASPYGDRDGEMGFSGAERAAINAGFFQRMDYKIDAVNRAGLLPVPALLWAADWSTPGVNETSPGAWLAKEQAILSWCWPDYDGNWHVCGVCCSHKPLK